MTLSHQPDHYYPDGSTQYTELLRKAEVLYPTWVQAKRDLPELDIIAQEHGGVENLPKYFAELYAIAIGGIDAYAELEADLRKGTKSVQRKP